MSFAPSDVMLMIHSNANNIFQFMKILKHKYVQYLNMVSAVELMLRDTVRYTRTHFVVYTECTRTKNSSF